MRWLFRSFAHFLNWIVHFHIVECSLCTLNNSHLLYLLFTNIFSNFLISINSSLSVLSFMSYAFDAVSKKLLLHPSSSRFSSMSSFRSLIAFHFAFKAITHFELNFFWRVQDLCLDSLFYMLMSNCSSTICWNNNAEKTVLSKSS